MTGNIPAAPAVVRAAAGSGVGGAPLPAALLDEQDRHPWAEVSRHARQRLSAALPVMRDEVTSYADSVFGLTSGFFYLPAAQGRCWGLRDEHVLGELLTVLALGHCHYVFQDELIDEGIAPAKLCLVSDTALLLYLDGLVDLRPTESTRYRRLHYDTYATYCAAILRDLRHRSGLVPYTASELAALGDKAAPGTVALHMVADLAGRADRAVPASTALLRLCTGLQLVDDLKDAVEDLRTGNRTWPVTAALSAYDELDAADPERVRAAVVGCGVAAGSLRLACAAFGEAAALADAADADVIADLARVWHRRAAAELRQLEALGLPGT